MLLESYLNYKLFWVLLEFAYQSVVLTELSFLLRALSVKVFQDKGHMLHYFCLQNTNDYPFPSAFSINACVYYV